METGRNQNPQNPSSNSSVEPSSPVEKQRGGKWLMHSSEFQEIQEIVGYKFNDLKLLHQAFTDPSYKVEGNPSYETLEYIGDSVLNLLVAREHYFDHPDLPPGKLTRLRAANVDNEKLARVALRWGLHKYLRHRKPLFDVQVQEFSKAVLEYPLHSSGLIDPPKFLADIVESLVGAIFIDCNSSLETSWQVVKNLLQPMVTCATLQIHPVTKLNEFCQKNAMTVKFGGSWETTGDFEISVDGEHVGRAQYKSKKLIAVNRAALDAYNKVSKKLIGSVANV